jgi:glycosyltransferase involved in cell wall biosynthesis
MPHTNNPSISIIIPAFNEASQIATVVEKLRQAGYTSILIVDDGSCDGTAEIARTAGVEVISHLINRGQGAALRTGIDFLTRTQAPDVIVTFDADGQHQPKDIPALIAPIASGNADIVLGSRFLSHALHIPLLRKIILKCGILFTNILSGIRLTDTHNGFRALGPKAYQSIRIVHRGMEHASDIIDEITVNKLRYQEVPTTILYTDYSKAKGQSSTGFLKIGLKVLLKKIL